MCLCFRPSAVSREMLYNTTDTKDGILVLKLFWSQIFGLKLVSKRCSVKPDLLIAVELTSPPSEESLRQTSMLLRTEPHWKLLEPLKGIGSRLKRDFFLVNCETEVVGKQILSWVSCIIYTKLSCKS